MNESAAMLKKYWGFDSFRPLQEEVIRSVLSRQDTIAMMPTGGGKSICFQVPAMVNEGICLVISPLIALMKDQVSGLKKKGIPVLSIHAGMGFTEVRKTLKNAVYGNFKFLYVSPERLQSGLFMEYFPELSLNLIAVDEAHCISQWGYDFRPSYLHISEIREYFPEVPVLALTASAIAEVRMDICKRLQFRKGYQHFNSSLKRPELSYSAFDLFSKQDQLLHVLNRVPGSGILFCKTRGRAKEMAGLLENNGISADYYHAGLTYEQRNKKQEDWINDKTRVMACTNAFGMGIDKADVRVVIHYDLPDALESYYQEAGRAGRDGNRAFAVLLYNQQEISFLEKQMDTRFPPREIIRNVYAALCNFFQLPSGSGEGLSFNFDIGTFVKNFKLDTFTVNSVLKILEQEELIGYSESFFSPPTVVFDTDRNTLNLLSESHPSYHKVIQGLLRSYDGIFDFPAIINENQLAKSISLPREELVSVLANLTNRGIIDYSPQKDKPQVRFLQNRVKAADLYINENNILKRKLAYQKRLQTMIRFAEEPFQCRSRMIADYFSSPEEERCGICDNCMKLAKQSGKSTER